MWARSPSLLGEALLCILLSVFNQKSRSIGHPIGVPCTSKPQLGCSLGFSRCTSHHHPSAAGKIVSAVSAHDCYCSCTGATTSPSRLLCWPSWSSPQSHWSASCGRPWAAATSPRSTSLLGRWAPRAAACLMSDACICLAANSHEVSASLCVSKRRLPKVPRNIRWRLHFCPPQCETLGSDRVHKCPCRWRHSRSCMGRTRWRWTS